MNLFLWANTMNKHDHAEAAMAAANILARGNLTPASKVAIIHHWTKHILATLGKQEVRRGL